MPPFGVWAVGAGRRECVFGGGVDTGERTRRNPPTMGLGGVGGGGRDRTSGDLLMRKALLPLSYAARCRSAPVSPGPASNRRLPFTRRGLYQLSYPGRRSTGFRRLVAAVVHQRTDSATDHHRQHLFPVGFFVRHPVIDLNFPDLTVSDGLHSGIEGGHERFTWHAVHVRGIVAEREGFEPPAVSPALAFEASPFDQTPAPLQGRDVMSGRGPGPCTGGPFGGPWITCCSAGGSAGLVTRSAPPSFGGGGGSRTRNGVTRKPGSSRLDAPMSAPPGSGRRLGHDLGFR